MGERVDAMRLPVKPRQLVDCLGFETQTAQAFFRFFRQYKLKIEEFHIK